jgi:BirA family biotin operon repressor/biotin-[acetyl-CoA-carboxylase] ligase
MDEEFWLRFLKARNAYQIFSEADLPLLTDCERRGYILERHPFYGVKWLVEETRDFWCKEECEAWCNEVGLRFPWKITIFSSTSSTNDEAFIGFYRDLIEYGIFIAEIQTQGRGRRGRSWDSTSPGGIYVSLCLNIDKISLPISLVTLGVGVAVFNALTPWVRGEITLKWPNDVLINRKKICGILTERQISGNEHREACIIGIGLNVLQKPTDWSDEVRPIATSIIENLRGNRPPRRAEILAHIIKECERALALDAETIRTAWSQRCLDIGNWVKVSQDQSQVAGQLMGIDKDGSLLLKNEQGMIKKLYSGDCVLCK